MALDGPDYPQSRLEPAAPVLAPGKTCWRLERANRVAVIIDAAEYFSEVKKAILQARHSVLLIGWDFDMRILLERENADPAVPNRLGDFLNYAVRRTPSLHIYVLRWDLAFVKRPSAGMMPAHVLNWIASPRLHFRLDAHHPSESCHHQKVAVIDDTLAFCGGIDITSDRWDTPAHQDHDPRRIRPGGSLHGPWHDVTTLVDGDAARALGELARERWRAGTGEWLAPSRPGSVRWPERLRPVFREVDVAIARTEPAYDGRPEMREVEALYLAAIRAARRTIYLESQYFSSGVIADALAQRLQEQEGPEIVVVNPKSARGWLEEEAMGPARALLLERLRAADANGRLRFCTPVTEHRADIYVHAKVLVVDDRLLRVGSSNINNRSLGVDTECDLAIEARPDDPRAERLRRSILEVRDSLVAEHLGVSREVLEGTLRETGGSLAVTLDRLMRPEGRSLVAFTAPDLTEAQRALAESHLLDPRRPERIDRALLHALPIERTEAARLGGKVAAFIALGLGAGALLRQVVRGRRPS